MRVLFDATCAFSTKGGTGAGIEHYTRSILKALLETQPGDLFYVAADPSAPTRPLEHLIGRAKNARLIKAWLPKIPVVSRHLLLPLRSVLVRPDVFFSPHGQLPMGWLGMPSVITVHDLCVFDHPEWFPDEVVSSYSTRHIVPTSIERADAIVCVSSWTESRLFSLFPQVQNKTVVVSEGVEMGHHQEMTIVDRFPFDRDYLLCLGTIEPRKNLPQTIRSFGAFLEIHPELAERVRLIIAGRRGWNTFETDQAALMVNRHWQDVEPDGVVCFLGPVTEEEKWHLLSRAAGLIFMSFEEGFGLPVLEAMSVGTPVITSRGSALEEVAGDSAILVERDDDEALSFAMAQCVLVPEGTQQMREMGYRWASRFSWEKAARETKEVFERARVLFASKR